MNNFFKKNLIFLLISVILLGGIILLLKFLPSPHRQDIKKDIIFSIQDKENIIELKEGHENILTSETLGPTFRLSYQENIDPASVSVYFDNQTTNLLTDDFFRGKINKENNLISFNFDYSLLPKWYQIEIEYNKLGVVESKKYDFNLIYHDDYNEALEKSKFWFQTEQTLRNHNNWFTKDGYLEASENTAKSSTSSLAFLYSFPENISVDFDLIPKSEKVNFSVYFGNTFSLILGDGDNYTIRLKKAEKGKNEIVLKAEKYLLETNNKYHVRFLRKNNTYHLYIKKADGQSKINIGDINEENLIFKVKDAHPEKTEYIKFDNIGFALWSGSSGVKVDNVYITENLENLEKEGL